VDPPGGRAGSARPNGPLTESSEQAHVVVERLRKDVDDLVAALERSDRVL